MKLLSLIEAQQLDVSNIFFLFSRAEEFRKGIIKPLNGKILTTLFYEASTRTRLSFEAAMLKLGGGVISTENAKEFSSAIKGESLEDTARVVSKYSDIIVVRHYEEGSTKKMAQVSSVPVINAGDGAGQHPTQALLDLYTIWREIGRIENFTIALVGDLKYGRTVRSLCYLLGKFHGVKVIFVSPEVLGIKEDIKDYLQRQNVKFEEETDFYKAIPQADIIYMTRIQKERLQNGEYEKIKSLYSINQESLAYIRKDARVLHPLPHTEEINLSIEVEQTDSRVAYFRQVENGLYIRMALISYLLE